MITYRTSSHGQLVIAERPDRAAWFDVKDATKEELDFLAGEYAINPEHIADILDIDELARIEKEDEYTLVIVRLPVFDARFEVAYYTVPLGILLFPDRIVTICHSDNEVMEDLRNGRVRGLDLRNKSAFLLHLLGRAAIVYLRHLKDINRQTAAIERDLQRSVKNNELTQLLSLEKSLVFFTTSLKSNEILLEKLQSSRAMRFKEDETELLEDVLTDNKQAIEMSNIYSDILSGMMDAFASVISNNLNIVMKRLTSISVLLMLSNLIVSAFSMNVETPLSGVKHAFWAITLVAAIASAIGAILISDWRPRRWKKALKSTVTGMAIRQ
ncbi:MAG: magnesium transporter CorA family protein [Rectinemataceae bacterium]